MTDTVWDGKSKVYSPSTDKFYTSPDRARKAFDKAAVKDRTLYMCDPIFPRELDCEYFEDDDNDIWEHNLPDELKSAIDDFNDKFKAVILGWETDYDRTMIV